MTSNINVNYHVTFNSILRANNLNKAVKQVVQNRGSGGIDRMTTQQLLTPKGTATIHRKIKDVREGKYKPLPVRRVYIPKDNGEQRPLGIPTVIDRVIQQAIANELTKLYEPKFSEYSYGFRPNRSCHHALNKVLDHIQDGYLYVIDMDLAKFFDTVNHNKLIQVLSERIKDPRVISLIHTILRTKIMEKGVAKVSTIGTPQGGPISPMLANILLNELDQELEKRGHKFVRYADDMIIFCKSERSAYRAFRSITKFIESKLFLKVNKDKTKVGRISRNYKFLGYCFTATVDSYGKVTAKARVHRKAVAKCKKQLVELLDRRAPGGFKETRKRFNYFTRGWFNYFSLHLIHSGRNLFNRLDEQIRRRIRAMYWKQWKTPQQRRKKLAQYKNHESIDCYSSARYQRVAMILRLVITNQVIECQHGWDTFNVLINKFESRTQMYGYQI